MDASLYKTLLKKSPFGFTYNRIILDDSSKAIDYEIIETNESFEHTINIPSTDIINNRASKIFKDVDLGCKSRLSGYAEIALDGGEKEYEQYSQKLNKWFKIQIFSFEKYFFAAIYTDITKKILQRQDLEGFLSVNLDLLCIADIKGNFLKVNKTWSDILGYSIDDLLNKNYLDLVHPNDLEATLRQVSKLKTEGEIQNYTNRYKCKDLSFKYIEWRSHISGNLVYASARDVTDSYISEERLKTSELYNRSLIEAIPDMIFVIDRNGKLCDLKDKAGKDLIMPKEMLIGKNISEVLDSSLVEKIMQEIDKLFTTGSSDPIVYQMTLNGSVGFFEYRLSKFGDSKVISIIQNITERKTTEEALQERENNFSSFFEAIDDIIFIANKKGEIIFTNDTASKKLLYSDLELKHMQILDIHQITKREEAQEIFSDMFAGKRNLCTLPLMRKDGLLIPVETRVWFGKWNGYECIFGLSKDISKEQEALQKFNMLFDSNPALMAVSEIPGSTFTEVNSVFLEKSGYSKEEVIGKTSLELELFPEQEKQVEIAKQLKKVGFIQNIDLKLRNKSGKLLDGLFSGTIIENQGKQYFLTVMTDITAQKITERELERSREQFMLAVAGSNDGIWDWDITNNNMYISPRWKEMLGYNDSEIENLFASFELLMFEEDKERVSSYLQSYLNGEVNEYKIEFRMIRKDGSLSWVLSKGQAYRDDKGVPYRMAGSHSDITEQKNTEETLVKQTALQNILMDISSKYINIQFLEIETAINDSLEQLTRFVGADRAYIFIYDFANSVCTNTHEWCQDDVIPQISELQNVPIESLLLWVETHSSGKSLYIPDVLALDKDDPTRAILEPQEIKSLITIPMMEENNCLGFVGFDFVKKYRTYTEKEEILLRVFSQMLVNVKHRSDLERKLIEEKARAESASRAKSEFLANMSHEIRTPLNGVIGFTELLKNSPLSAVQKQYVDNANISAHSLLGIINDILDFSKIEAGKLDLDVIMTDVVELVEQSSDIIKYQSSKKNIELLLNIDPLIPRFAKVDPIRLKQIIVNLLSNAVKFTEQGEIEIKVCFQKVDQEKGLFTFSVKDTGIGISEEQKSKLFKAFSQADSSTTRKFGGTGLGLVISNLLAEKMGSRIELYSEQGVGSTFYFTIETTYEIGDKLTANSVDDIKRVLVIDDNDNNRMILEHTLKSWGIEFVGSSNGFSSLNLIETSRPFDVIIIDYHMPYLNGIDTIKMIREKLYLTPEKQPIILLHSSSDDISIHEECKKLGVRFNLIKPVKAQELLHYLKNVNSNHITDTVLKSKTNETERLAGIITPTILVVEDVDLNMILVTTIIKQLIPNVTIIEAKNGKIALDIAKIERPSLILMDVQMPVMNGLEATTLIREHEVIDGLHTPIIALSAGVVKGEKEKCIESGMDDFISKPISVDELRFVFEKYLFPSFKDDMHIIDGKINDRQEHFDQDSLLEKLGNDKDIFNKIMETAHLDIQKDIDEIVLVYRENNIEKVKNVSHAIKGVALTLCFNKLGLIAKEIEKNCESEAFNMELHIKSIVNEWNLVKSLISTSMR